MERMTSSICPPDETLNLMLVGAGPHAKRFYIPALERMRAATNVRIRAIVELEATRKDVEAFAGARGLDADLIFVEPFEEILPTEVRQRLSDAVKRHDIRGVIIATDPLTHRVYGEWALKQGLHILMDKPISTRSNVVSDIDQAAGIEDDYLELFQGYQNLQRAKQTCFIICAHRRYHPGISYVIEQIRDVSLRTGCPVTSIHSYHSDGQWRMPSEIVTQYHHTYYRGYGKASHSGYHFFDCVYRFVKAGAVAGKEPDEMRIYASFVQPEGLLEQMQSEDYYRLFGDAYAEVQMFSDDELQERYRGYGEVDVDAVITFARNDRAVCNASVNLIHNGFSRRAWMHAPEDLYKGNGRVKHEQHRIHVGPFLGIQVHSYQAKDKHQKSGFEDLQYGGNNHFDIVVFRNQEMLGEGRPLEILRLTDLEAACAFDKSQLFIEQVKEGAIEEFLAFVRGERRRLDLKSSIEDHAVPVQIMSGVYVSHNLGRRGRNPLVKRPILLSASDAKAPSAQAES